jgi:uncharacterized membrane protein
MVVASMLVSPLMGPILAFTFGAAIDDRGMMWRGLKNETMAFFITVFLGFVLGLVLTPFADVMSWPTNEMAARGDVANFVVRHMLCCFWVFQERGM